MTREEAIARIKDHIEVHHIKEDRAIKIVQALNMAIEALERTKWHYPSKGDLPKAEDFYIVAVSVTEGVGAFSTVMDYSPNANRWTDCTGHEEHHVIAWMPLPEPPKEEA